MAHREIEIEVVCDSDDNLPHYASEGAAGADVKAAIQNDVIIAPGATALIGTGLKMALPHGYELQLRPRSGLALKSSVTVLNTPGTIDSDYRGEVGVILINHGREPFVVKPGMRIAQAVIAPVMQGRFVRSAELTETARGAGGFGHTGTH